MRGRGKPRPRRFSTPFAVKQLAASADRASVTFNVSPQVRPVVLIGVFAAVGLALALFIMLSRAGAGANETVATTTPPRHAGSATPHRGTTGSNAAVRAAAKDLRPEVVRALAANRVVVVLLWAPGSSTDDLARREAEAGARLAGAEFVLVDVTREREVRPLTERLGLLEDPAVLVYGRRSATPDVRFDGFADREAVAQAAANVGSSRARRGS